MIISTSHRFIFVHVPKTAGDSVTTALAPFAHPLERTVWRSVVRRLQLKDTPETIYLRKHDPASKAIAKLGRKTFDAFTSFAVVRNPFDHAVSHYEFMKQFRIPKIAAKVAAMPFADYLEYRMKPPFWNDTFFARLPNQSYFLTDIGGHLVIDRLIRFENLADDFSETMQSLGLGEVTIPHVNKTKSKSEKTPFQSYYDDQSIALVNKLYKEDFDLLGYRRDLPV